ncbi:DNA polymerase epsilon subunit 2 isoform X2 [Canis lupus baileyi]|uniref:DNA polymerase epsilon subunit 2 isoform X2 n=1 Tax=Canis lupus dingo TaxID=286419 RepID=UPI0015F195A3|nr:DNA polymerase epsilon subunit 2 isoform X2 [Canis lupus dingo]XP_038400559.1 DNA polymerase epsilon subunit 2 isoform X2 [Canis lupus familiaris]XP_038442454.1 DNA polymerase epsilon subunit 2 isoform X2 [Canis lupus familiaris]XP_038529488.1 DNA polymerase epsilon subunit 2 isoform X2 [Canis lupus familiaris]
MAPERLRSRMVSAFKLRGLLLRGEAIKYLTEALESISEVELEDALEKIIDAVEKQPLSSNMIERSVVEAAVQECSQLVDETMSVFCGLFFREHIFNIIGAFDIPRFVYSSERKKFLPLLMTNHPAPNLFGTARDKAELFLERYTILHQRTHRHELFTPPVIGSHPDETGSKFQVNALIIIQNTAVTLCPWGICSKTPSGCLKPQIVPKPLKTIETLLGSTAKIGDVIVLGMITQLKEGKFFLEDPTGTVQLDLSKAQFHSGLYTESCFVLAEGWFEDRVFHVNAFGFPPTEPSSTTRAYYGNVNFFGGPSNTSVKTSAKLKQLEEENKDAMFVFISDVWLDQGEVLRKLHTMFSGYSPAPPTCFIMCGNFSSAPYGKSQIQALKDSLKTLADIICEYPNIHQSRFVFIPGPEDPGFGSILPRPPIAESITNEFRQRVPFSVFTTNPCRIQYCTQEIIVFREDLVNKMCRNCVRFPSSNLDIPNHFVKTILSQGHLTPLPLYVSPVYWAYDYALRVYPVPDLLVIADKYDPFTLTNTECLCINPGSFPRSGFSFKVFYPSNKTVEDSKLQGF